jgi:putative hemolysin
VAAATRVGDVFGPLALEVPEDEIGTYHTLGGFVLARLGRIPTEADAFDWRGVRFEVLDMDGRRIDKVLVTPGREATAVADQ